MKKPCFLSVIVSVLALASAAKGANLTTVVSLGSESTNVTYTCSEVDGERHMYNTNPDRWGVLKGLMRDAEGGASTTTTVGKFKKYGYTERQPGFDYDRYCQAQYHRCENSVSVSFPTGSGYVGASLEWVVWFQGTGQVRGDDTTYGWPLVCLGTNRASVATSVGSNIRQVLWPDYTPQGDTSDQFCQFVISKPVLNVVTRTSAQGMPDQQNRDEPVAYCADPISTISGSVSLDEPDLLIPACGVPLNFVRWHDTVLGGDPALGGGGWSHTYYWRIGVTNTVYQGATNSWLVLRAGNDWHWKELSVGNGGHAIDDGWRWSWVQTSGCYRVFRPGGISYGFDTNGILVDVRTPAAEALHLTYTNTAAGARLSSVRHSDGRALTFQYNISNLLDRVESPSADLMMHFSYNDNGLLTNATQKVGSQEYATTYQWDAPGHAITQRLDAAGVVTVWEPAGTKAVHSYIGTNRWYETWVEYGSNGLNRTQVTQARGDTNVVYAVDVDPVRRKVVRTSAKMPAGMLCSLASSIYTNCFFYQNGDSWGVLHYNPYYVNQVEAGLKYDGTPSSAWAGTDYVRDDYGRVTAVADRNGNGQTYGQVAVACDALGRMTNMAYAYQANPTNTWQLTWNTNWDLLASVTDPEGKRTEWDYTNGLVSRIRIFPATNQPAETCYAYTTNGLLAAVTNANGHWVRYQSDVYGYPTSVIPQAGPTNWMVWDALGHLKELRMPSTEKTTNEPAEMVPRTIDFDSDELGRVRGITWPDGSSETFAFDAVGNVTNHTDAAGRSTRYTWLPTRKLESVTRGGSSLGATNRLEYDQQFNTKRVIDELGRAVESYQLDLQDRPTTVSNVDQQVMTINWGLADVVQSIVRFDGTTNAFGYDEGGRPNLVTYPGAALAFRYLKNGLLTTASNQWGVISNAFDGANRLVSVATPVPNGTVSYTLYPAGQVSNTMSVAGTNTYALDPAERLVTLTASRPSVASGAFQYSFNPVNGLASSVVYPNGMVCAATYDKMDRLAGLVWKNASNQVVCSRSYGYSAIGLITNIVYETGEQVDYNYDSLDRLTGEKHLNAAGQVVSDETYGYDLAGNRTNKTVWAGSSPLITVGYGMGTDNRLTSWSVAQTDLVGQVDVAGASSEVVGTNDRFGWLYVSNLNGVAWSKPYVMGTNFWAYDLAVGLGTQKIVAAIRDQAGNTTRVTNQICLTVVTNGTYQYSPAGCVTNITYRGKDYVNTLGLTWDGQYQVAGVSTNGTAAERYGYDAAGRRIWVWDAANGTNWHVYDGLHVIADLNATGGLLRAYTYGPGIDNILAMTAYGGTTGTYYYVKDHLGAVLALTDKDGAVVESYRYGAWGRTTVYDASGSVLTQSAYGNRYCWQGREYSWKSGLYYFRARWFAPVEGRWLSSDPIGISGGLNQYVFCLDNPLNTIDPMGLCGGNQPEWRQGRRPQAAYTGGIRAPRAIGFEARVNDLTYGQMPVDGGSAQLAEINATAIGIALDFAPWGPTAVRGGVGPVLKGQQGVARAIEEIEAGGGTILGREITLETGAVRTRPDLLVRTADGRTVFVEVKNGSRASLSPNQRAGFAEISAGGAVPRGANASAAGLEVGVPLPPTAVQVIRY